MTLRILVQGQVKKQISKAPKHWLTNMFFQVTVFFPKERNEMYNRVNNRFLPVLFRCQPLLNTLLVAFVVTIYLRPQNAD